MKFHTENGVVCHSAVGFFKLLFFFLVFSSSSSTKLMLMSLKSNKSCFYVCLSQTCALVGSGIVSQMSSAGRDACREVRQVNLPDEIQSPYFILRPLCVAK